MTGGFRVELEASRVKLLLSLLISLLLSTFVSAEPNLQKRITRSYVGVDLRDVLKDFAAEAEVGIYYSPGIRGTVTLDFTETSIDDALRHVLTNYGNGCSFRLHPVGDGTDRHTLVIAEPEILAVLDVPGCGRTKPRGVRELILREYPLQATLIPKVLEFLKGQYPSVEFEARADQTGFLARGDRVELVQIQRELDNLDRSKLEPPPLVSEQYLLRHVDPKEALEPLRTLVPGVLITLDRDNYRGLHVKGSPGEQAQVLELLSDVDRDLDN